MFVINEYEETETENQNENDNLSATSSQVFDDKHLLKVHAMDEKLSDSISNNLGIWEKYLITTDDDLIYADNLMDLAEQSIIKEDCERLIDALKIPDNQKKSTLLSLQIIIIIYCKSEQMIYEQGNGWIELLGPLVMVNFPRLETYNLFKTIRDNYIAEIGTHGFIMHLLLQYHDPQLCKFFDNQSISITEATKIWINTLFAGVCSLPVVLSIWKYLLKSKVDDPFFIFFLCLVIILEYRTDILEIRTYKLNNSIENIIAKFPYPIKESDVDDLIKAAEMYNSITPSYFKIKYYPYIFGSQRQHPFNMNAICLPVSAQDVMRNIFITSPVESDDSIVLKFFVVDCRPMEQFNAGHLPVGYHVDCNSIYQPDFMDYVNELKNLQVSKRPISFSDTFQMTSKHITIMGSGLPEGGDCVQVVVLDLVQSNTAYVSVIDNGYLAVHKYFGQPAHNYFIDHDNQRCLVCLSSSSEYYEDQNDQTYPLELPAVIEDEEINEPATDMVNNLAGLDQSTSFQDEVMHSFENSKANAQSEQLKLSERMRMNLTERGKEAKDKLIHWVHANVGVKKISNSKQKLVDTVSIKEWLKKPEVLKSYPCKQIDNGKQYDSYLLITNSHLIVLRTKSILKKKNGYITASSPLKSLERITASAKNLNLMTFHLDITDETVQAPSDKLKFIISEGGEAVKFIQQKMSKKLSKKSEGTRRMGSRHGCLFVIQIAFDHDCRLSIPHLPRLNNEKIVLEN